jgi:hypothetical protein
MKPRIAMTASALVACALGASLAACSLQTSRAERLDEHITEGTRRLRAVGTEFGAALRPFLSGDPGDRAALRDAHASMALEVRRLQDELSAVALPALEGAAEYAAEYERFLELQREFVEGPYAELVTRLSEAAAASPDAAASAGALVREVAAREQRALEALREARARLRLAASS